jgi:predicted metal-dependent phosphoesterase TrpH
MLVDLHVHTAERSGCAMSPAVDQLAAACDAGLGAVAVTDHHELTTPAIRAEWRAQFPNLLVLPGIEITLDDECEDILVVGLDDRMLVRGSWSWRDLQWYVREHGGLTILAHPFRFADEIGIDLDESPPDAIEAWSSNIKPGDTERIRRIADRLGPPVVANSDAHWTEAVGGWANRLHGPAESVAEVLDAIREGRFTPEVR